MKLLYIIPLLMSIESILADLSQDTLDLITSDKVDDCTPNQDSCPFEEEGDAFVDYTIASITLNDVYEVDGSMCCYSYTSTHSDDRRDCNDDNKELSHWTLSYICPETEEENPTVVSSTLGEGIPSLGDDKSTCYHGIKFDSACGRDEPCNYEVCISWSDHRPGQCCTETGWFIVKAGTAFSFAETQVPRCRCPACNPVVNIWTNEGCTDENFEAVDTEVEFTKIRTYEELSDIGPDFTDDLVTTTIPGDPLSQAILDHGCEEDATTRRLSVDTVVAPLKTVDHKDNVFNVDNIKDWLEYEVFGGYKAYSYVITGLTVYSVSLMVMVLMFRQKKRVNVHKTVNEENVM